MAKTGTLGAILEAAKEPTRITRVAVEYRELRSSGHPTFGNVTHGVTYEATVGGGDDCDSVRIGLHERAKHAVWRLHGDDVEIPTLGAPVEQDSKESPSTAAIIEEMAGRGEVRMVGDTVTHRVVPLSQLEELVRLAESLRNELSRTLSPQYADKIELLVDGLGSLTDDGEVPF